MPNDTQLEITEEENYILVNGNKIYVDKTLRKSILDEYVTKPNDCALSQFISISKIPGVIEAIGLPDFHIGYALPIGSIAAIDLSDPNASITPNGIGFDINCGVRCLKTNIDIKDLTDEIKNSICDLMIKEMPFGDLPADKQITLSELNGILNDGMDYLLRKGIVNEDDINRTESKGSLKGNSRLISQKSKGKGLSQIGTLGSGNHYLEFEVVDEIFDEGIARELGLKKGSIVVSIHTGSRGLGHNVCTDIMDEIVNELENKQNQELYAKKQKEEFMKISNDETLSKAEKADKYAEIKKKLQNSHSSKKSKINYDDYALRCVPIETPLGQKYISVMNSAANYAWANRSYITHKVRKIFKKIFPDSKIELISDACHNIGKIENKNGNDVMVLRKGASRVLPQHHPDLPKEYFNIGLPILVGGSMGTSSYIIVGDEKCTDSYYSTCHGSGRIVSRGASKKTFSYERVLSDLKSKGIMFRSGSREGMVEECPECYKDIDNVINHAQKVGISRKVARVKPLMVIKG